jgi:adenylate cyclase
VPPEPAASAVPDFAALGLLDGLEDGPRAARERLLTALHADGVGVDELRAATEEGRLLLLPAERAIGGAARYTAAEIAQQSGIDPDLLLALRRAEGLSAADTGARAFTESDLELARTTRAFRDAGIDDAQLVNLSRLLGRTLSQVAEAMRAVTLELVLEPGTDEHDLAMRYAEAAAQLEPLVGPMLGLMMRRHLRDVVRTELLTAAERDAGTLPGAREVAVAFADLVGFTRVGEEVAPDELGRIADRLEQLAADRIEGPVRLVKTIGDAVMLVSPEVDPLLDQLLDLVDAADAEGEDFPQLRAGVARGPALSRAGDWYGRTVNVASRVTGVARPASVLVTTEVREAAGDGLRFSRAGERRLKGMREPTRLFRARRLVQD